jgi:hypothetical protein
MYLDPPVAMDVRDSSTFFGERARYEQRSMAV